MKKDHQLFDLQTRDGLITSSAYTLGANHGEVWIKPALDALGGTPPRFYIWTPFYFFGMPFVFADPGVVLESLGKRSFGGEKFDAIRVTYKKGTGDSSDDSYIALCCTLRKRRSLSAENLRLLTYSASSKHSAPGT